MIVEANTCLCPYAVVVHFILASSAGAAVIDSWKFEIVAQVAILVGWGVKLVGKFLRRGSF